MFWFKIHGIKMQDDTTDNVQSLSFSRCVNRYSSDIVQMLLSNRNKVQIYNKIKKL